MKNRLVKVLEFVAFLVVVNLIICCFTGYWKDGWVLIGIMAGTYYAFLRWPFEPDLSEYFE